MPTLYTCIAPVLRRHSFPLLNRLLYHGLMLREPRPRREHTIPGGDRNPDKTFYVIRREDSVGLFSYYVSTLGHIKHALDRGCIPVVDMMNYPNALISDSEKGHVNGWEVFFQQPCGYSLEEAYASRNVRLSYVGATLNRPYQTADFVMNAGGGLQNWRQIARQHIRFNPETTEHLRMEEAKVFGNGERCLGVLCRGTDYTKLKPARHPIQPPTGIVIEKARFAMQEQQCTRLFLATEDEAVFKDFHTCFGTALTNVNSTFAIFDGRNRLSDSMPADPQLRRRQNFEYLTAVTIHAKCPCFIVGMTSGTLGVFLLGEGFEYSHVWDLGVY